MLVDSVRVGERKSEAVYAVRFLGKLSGHSVSVVHWTQQPLQQLVGAMDVTGGYGRTCISHLQRQRESESNAEQSFLSQSQQLPCLDVSHKLARGINANFDPDQVSHKQPTDSSFEQYQASQLVLTCIQRSTLTVRACLK